MIRQNLTALLVSENRALRAENEMLRRSLQGQARQAPSVRRAGSVGDASATSAQRFDEVRISHAERTLLLDSKRVDRSRIGSDAHLDRTGRQRRHVPFWARLLSLR